MCLCGFERLNFRNGTAKSSINTGRYTVDYLLCGDLPYPAWKKRVSVQNLSNKRIRRYLVCRLKRPEARGFSHVRFTNGSDRDRIWNIAENKIRDQIGPLSMVILMLFHARSITPVRSSHINYYNICSSYCGKSIPLPLSIPNQKIPYDHRSLFRTLL